MGHHRNVFWLLFIYFIVCQSYIPCPNGWFRYEESCYDFLRIKSSWHAAKQICNNQNSTMFVVDSYNEWNIVRKHATPYLHSWLGLSWVLDSTQLLNVKTFGPYWETEGGIDPEILPWAIRTTNHGRVLDIDCISYYHLPILDQSKVYYRSCRAQFEVICERNSSGIQRVGPLKSSVRNTVNKALNGDINKSLGLIGIKGAETVDNNTDMEKSSRNGKFSIDWQALARLFGSH